MSFHSLAFPEAHFFNVRFLPILIVSAKRRVIVLTVLFFGGITVVIFLPREKKVGVVFQWQAQLYEVNECTQRSAYYYSGFAIKPRSCVFVTRAALSNAHQQYGGEILVAA